MTEPAIASDDADRSPPGATQSAGFPTSADRIVPAVSVPSEVISLRGVCVEAPGPRRLLSDLSLTIRMGEHWAVLGRNGAGKTTLLNVVRGVIEPTSGAVRVLGEHLGAPGFRDPKLRIGFVEAAPPTHASNMTATQVVVLRGSGPPALRGTQISIDEFRQARALLRLLGCGELVERRYAVCSRGERQRINLARALLREPAILALDEPAAGLDLPGRAAFLYAMQRLSVASPNLTTITVSHHVEELPSSTTHAALLRDGALVASGPLEQTLTDAALSECFGVAVAVSAVDGRWTARVADASW